MPSVVKAFDFLGSFSDRGGNPQISRNERARNGGTRGEAAEEVKGFYNGGHGGSQGKPATYRRLINVDRFDARQQAQGRNLE